MLKASNPSKAISWFLQSQTLLVVANNPGATLAKIGQELCISKMAACYRIKRLRERGFLSVKREGRKLNMEVTKRGQTFIASVREHFNSILS